MNLTEASLKMVICITMMWMIWTSAIRAGEYLHRLQKKKHRQDLMLLLIPHLSPWEWAVSRLLPDQAADTTDSVLMMSRFALSLASMYALLLTALLIWMAPTVFQSRSMEAGLLVSTRVA